MSSMAPGLDADSSRINGDDDDNDNDNDIGDLSLPVDQQRHLMEIESSFRIDSDIGRPDVRPSSVPPNRLSPHREDSREEEDEEDEDEEDEEDKDDEEEGSEADPSTATGDETTTTTLGQRDRSSSTAAIVGEMSSPTSEDIENLESLASSPTALARARNMTRAATAASNLNEMFQSHEGASSPEAGTALERQTSSVSSQGASRDYGALAMEAPPPPAATNSRSAPRLIPNSSSSSTLNMASTSSSYKRRPKILRPRDASQRSSFSSVSDMQAPEDDENSTITVEERQGLSRQTSLGSIASGITAFGGGSTYSGDRTVSTADRALARLDEEERNSRRGSVADDADTTATPVATAVADNRPSTPKERAPPLPQPTETAITAQVKNVRVPPTIKREYSRHLGAPGSPSKKAVAAAGTPATGRGREMTLKEQTASIDRLQKENFDLKIKVYYLNEKLEKQSDEGVKEALQENVDMKVKLAEGMRERKALKRRVRELEKKVEELGGEKQREEEASAAAESEEIWELKERVERYELEIEDYRRRDAERNERLRDFRRQANGHQVNEEQLEQLRDILTSETARREAQEAENLRLREEIYRLRAQDAGPLSRTTSRSVSERDHSQSRADRNVIAQLSQTHRENEELRREVSAQTSMLTSRNREKERLYAEIEDLKLTMRGGGSGAAFESASRAPSVFSDRLLDRSVSRAGGIASAAGTHVSSAITETEREDFENTNGALRDRISELRIKNQDLEQQLETCYSELEQRQQELNELEDELVIAHTEVQEMQVERNEALRMREDIELDFEQLKEEAEEEMRRLEDELDIRGNDILRLEEDGRHKEEDFGGLQQELRNVSDVVVRLEDQQEAHHNETRRLEERIQEFQHTIRENEQEMNVLENTLREANEKIERLTVQGESAKGEIAFLREEQDGDKIKIGELESTIKQFEKAIEDERDRVREARQQMDSERNQREQRGDLKQQEWERRLNEKSEELTTTKDEIRRLKGKVCNREDEAKTWRERLEELERGLREALGDLGGTRTGLMQSVLNLQSELEATLEELDYTKNELTEKNRHLKDRENLLESMALESRKLTDLLEKERNSHRHDKYTLETLQTTSTHNTRRISQHQAQTTELEKQRQREAKSVKLLEDQFREQIAERNSLLTQVWQRLSTVCGADWVGRNSLVATVSATPSVNEGKLSMEVAILSAFPGFTRNLLSAVKTIESIVAGFKTKCRGVERDLWKEYQVVENALGARTRRIERLEGIIRGGIGESSSQIRTEVAKLRAENRLLKVEVDVLKQEATATGTTASATTATTSGTATPPVRTITPGTNSSIPAPASSSSSQPQPRRSHTTHASSHTTHASSRATTGTTSPVKDPRPMAMTRTDSANSATSDGGEKRWILRLRELEKRLKQEREARLLDRSMANKKIRETRGEKEEIRRELERERVRGEK